jgi:mannose-1-phosphate guanylyltransferase
MAVLTADHLIEDAETFRQTLADAADTVSSKPMIGVIGIVPEFAATGYGYIESEGDLDLGTATRFMQVRRFVEKPDEATAKKYVESGRHFWNSGMFLWAVSTFKSALREFRPQLLGMMERLEPKFGMPDFEDAFLAEYNQLDKISVDYAIMEKANNIVAARGDFGWDDVGTWASASDHFEQDAAANAVHGRCELLRASNNTVVNDDPGHLVAVMDVENLVIVHTSDATLVCKKEAAQGLKELVKQIALNDGKAFT